MFDSIDRNLPRRTVLTGLPLAAGAGMMAVRPGLAQGAGPGLASVQRAAQDPVENLRMYMKLLSDVSGAPTYAWYSGQVFGFNQGELTTPLLGIEGFGMGRSLRQPNGDFKHTWKEVGYYKDLVTDEILDDWTNPYNNASCKVMHINNRSVNLTYTSKVPPIEYPGGKAFMGANYLRRPKADESKEAIPFTVPWFVNGDMAATEMDARVTGINPLDPREWPRESSGERYSVTEFFAQYCSVKDLLDPKVTAAPATGHWTRLSPWLPWMLMGQKPGQIVLRCVTRKLMRYDEVPQRLRDYTRKNFPAFTYLSTPEEEALPPESSWEVFKTTRKPTL